MADLVENNEKNKLKKIFQSAYKTNRFFEELFDECGSTYEAKLLHKDLIRAINECYEMSKDDYITIIKENENES